MKSNRIASEPSSQAQAQQPLAERFKLLRTIHGISLAELAERTLMTKSYLSKIERGLSEPSFASVLKLCQAYGITTGQLVGEEPSIDRLQVTRKNERTPLRKLKNYQGYLYEAIANKRADKFMQPFVMHPPAKQTVEDQELVSHHGQELIFVIKGEIELITHDKTLRLAAGDAAYFDSTIPHRSFSVGRTPAEVLVVIAGIESDQA
jgi:transcriptional regulator with XRE-family HTH domain